MSSIFKKYDIMLIESMWALQAEVSVGYGFLKGLPLQLSWSYLE